MVGADTRVVMVAEDEAGLRESLADIFGLEGHTVIECGDGADALAILEREAVDVLVLDLHMPRRDGISLLRAIDSPPPVVVIYSAFEFYSPEEVRDLIGSKVFRALRKPVAPLELVATVSAAIAEIDGPD